MLPTDTQVTLKAIENSSTAPPSRSSPSLAHSQFLTIYISFCSYKPRRNLWCDSFVVRKPFLCVINNNYTALKSAATLWTFCIFEAVHSMNCTCSTRCFGTWLYSLLQMIIYHYADRSDSAVTSNTTSYGLQFESQGGASYGFLEPLQPRQAPSKSASDHLSTL